jgi:Beta/Gamma crystallin
MNAALRNALVVAGVAFATQAAAEVTFYEHEGFKGQSFNTGQQVANFKRFDFDDRASSVVVDRDWWQVCEDAQFAGRCAVLRPGRYRSLVAGFERP